MRKSVGALAAMLLLPAGVVAEDAGRCEPAGELVVDGLGTFTEELARLAELAPGALAPGGSGILRRGAVTTRTVCAGARLPWAGAPAGAAERPFAAVDPRLTLTWGTSPGGANDGLLWQGRGFAGMVSGGLRGRWGPLSAQLAPEVAWAQNDWYPTRDTGRPGRLRYANWIYGSSLDVPQRFGQGRLWTASLGQSRVQVEGYGTRFGLSTENVWWGPGIRHAVLLTNNAPGFPHLFLGTSHPVDVWIGDLEAEWFVGELSRSRYTDERSDRAYTGLAFTLRPRWLPGFYLGGGRTFIEDWASLRRAHFLSVLGSTNSHAVTPNPSDNQLFTAWFRWVMPDIELYGEYAQDDFPTFNSFLRQPDRCGLWTFGFQKRIADGDAWWRVVGEAFNSATAIPAWEGCTAYIHERGADETNQGQLLVDAAGPGADAQYLAIDRFSQGGRVGGYLERVRRNQQAYWSLREAGQIEDGNDVEIAGGVRQVVVRPRYEVSWDLRAGQHFKRDFVRNEFVLRLLVTVSPRVAALAP